VAATDFGVDEVLLYGTYPFEIARTDEPQSGAADLKIQRLISERAAGGEPLQVLVQCLKDQGLQNKMLGIDHEGLSPRVLDLIVKSLSRATIKDSSELFLRARMVKTKEEVQRVRRSIRATEKGIGTILEKARIGIAERELAAEFEKTLIDEGASPGITVLAFGNGTGYVNPEPSGRTLSIGNLIKFDGGGFYKAYVTDIARTFVFGEPTNEQVRTYRAIQEGESEALKHIKPGVKACEVFKVAVETVRRQGIPHYRRHNCGHGIGMKVYEPPFIAPNDETPLEEGMVLCVETPYVELGHAGFIVEDTVLVTESGCELLSTLDTELVTLAVR